MTVNHRAASRGSRRPAVAGMRSTAPFLADKGSGRFQKGLAGAITRAGRDLQVLKGVSKDV